MTGVPVGLSNRRTELPDAEDLARKYVPGSARAKNLGRILTYLNRRGPQTRADLVAATGLNKATVASAVIDLIDWGLLAEHELTYTGQSGRPSRPVDIAGAWIHGLGLELRTDRVVGLLSDLAGNTVASGDMPFWSSCRDVSELPAHEIDTVLAEVAVGLLRESEVQGGFLAGVCVSVPGQVQRRRGQTPQTGTTGSANTSWTRTSPYDWTISGAVEHLEQLLASNQQPCIEVKVERSPNLAAVAELWTGTVASSSPLVTISGGVALGAGVMIDGEPVSGASGLVGDVGHLVIDPGGNRCRCGGRGCWETMVGVEAVLRECAPDLAGNARTPRSSAVIREVQNRALHGDLVAIEGLERVGYWLGVGIASVVAVLNPKALVLDGYFCMVEPWIFDEMMATLTSHLTGPASEDLEVSVSRLDGSASTLGASLLASGHVFAEPIDAMLAAAVR